jgi:pimeloyl-ACP methyl ester carboxylesterase
VVHAVILDGVYPPQASGQANIPATYSRSLRAVYEASASNALCNTRYPALAQTFDELLEHLHAQPPPVQYADPNTARTSTIPLNGKTFLALLFTLLYQKEGIQLVPALIELTAAGDLGAVESLLPNLGAYGTGVGEGAYYAIECTDEGQRAPLPTTALEPLPGVAEDMAYGDQLVAICAEYPARPSQPGDDAAVNSEIPTLLLVGAYDPVTPLEYAQLAAESLANVTIVQFADQGHGALTSGGCATGIIAQFLAQPEQAPIADCSQHGTLEFVLPTAP